MGRAGFPAALRAAPYCHANHRYTIYFVAEFNRPFTSFGTWDGPVVNKGQHSVSGVHTGGWVAFDTTKYRDVEMRIASRLTSEIASAWKNLGAAEIPAWDFGTVRQAAHARVES